MTLTTEPEIRLVPAARRLSSPARRAQRPAGPAAGAALVVTGSSRLTEPAPEPQPAPSSFVSPSAPTASYDVVPASASAAAARLAIALAAAASPVASPAGARAARRSTSPRSRRRQLRRQVVAWLREHAADLGLGLLFLVVVALVETALTR